MEEKQIVKCTNHLNVFITNKLIIKATKAFQPRAASDSLFSFIVWLILMQQMAYIKTV